MKFPRFGHGSRQGGSERGSEVLLNQHDVADTLRLLAEAYAGLDDLQGSMALHAAANGFENGRAIPGVGFSLGQPRAAGLSDPRGLSVARP